MNINQKLRAEMRADIQKCSEYPDVKGSGALMDQMIAKYSLVDPDFAKATCRIGKATIIGQEADYRKELKAAAERLKAILLSNPPDGTENMEDEFSLLVEEIPRIEDAFWEAAGGLKIIYDTPIFCQWKEKLKFSLRKLKKDETIAELLKELDSFNGYSDVSLFSSVSTKVRLINDRIKEYMAMDNTRGNKPVSGNKVFIVHGHDNEAKVTVARTLEQLGLEAVILHEQPDQGKTIIEKLETFTSEVAYAIILYTECDLGRAKEKDESANQFRARQNVVFEHGLFVGSLGRNRVCALVKGKIEKPGDLDGIVYVTMDDAGAWKLQLCKNLKAVGIDADANKLI